LSLFSPQTHAPIAAIEVPYELNAINTPNKSVASMNPSPLQNLLQLDAGSPTQSLSSANLSPLRNVLHTDMSMEMDGQDSDPSLLSRETRSPTSRVRTHKQARRATASSPIYGHVTGVLRGPDAVHGMVTSSHLTFVFIHVFFRGLSHTGETFTSNHCWSCFQDFPGKDECHL
jgi:hypothetical protein